MAGNQNIGKKMACVIGGEGFLGSMLVKLLLEKGYAVNATAREPDNQEQSSHLLALKSLGDLKIFRADLTDEGSFDAPVAGCDFVFHVASPINLASEDPENDMIKPAIQGTHNVLKACIKAKTVKRVIWTSSIATVTMSQINENGLVMDETNWSDVDFLTTTKPPTWGYAVSKILAEKAAWKFAEENKIDLITVIPPIIVGPSLTPEIPNSTNFAMSLITGNAFLINMFKNLQMLTGSISMSHVEDVCGAHIFLAEKDTASGRYICSAVSTSVPVLVKLLNDRYPMYNITTEFGDLPSKPKLINSSEKLIKEGFSFKYEIEDIYDQSVEYFKVKGVLKN